MSSKTEENLKTRGKIFIWALWHVSAPFERGYKFSCANQMRYLIVIKAGPELVKIKIRGCTHWIYEMIWFSNFRYILWKYKVFDRSTFLLKLKIIWIFLIYHRVVYSVLLKVKFLQILSEVNGTLMIEDNSHGVLIPKTH